MVADGTFETLRVERPSPGLAIVALNRPDRRNAMNTQMGREMRDLFVPLRFTPGELRCIVITGAGDRAFSAGGDLKERRDMSDEDWRLQHAVFEEAYYAIMDCPVPTIAAVNGAAFAGGCELALACDLIHAAENARFALTETSIGIMPGAGGTQNLPRAVGQRRAMELILTAQPFSAAEALGWGMVNAVWPADELMPRVQELAERICANAPIAVRQAKKAIRYGPEMSLANGLQLEVQAYGRLIPTEDRHEGILAFNEKRPPRFTGR